MNELQEVLSSNVSILDDLHIGQVTDGELTILNYNQIESPKFNPVVEQCRGTVIRGDQIIARGFNRFYNWGENPNEKCSIQDGKLYEKIDGSFMLMYYYNEWRVNTRNSFAQGETNGVKWADLFWRNIKYWGYPHYSWVFELVSPYNIVVSHYPESLYLLAAYDNHTELSEDELNFWAKLMGVKRPQTYSFSAQEAPEYLEKLNNGKFEGFVVKDHHNNRLKIKNKDYLALHKMKNNGYIATKRGFIDFYIEGEHGELSATFPEFKTLFNNYGEALDKLVDEAQSYLDRLNHLPQKEFALSIQHLPYKSILFQARKNQSTVRASLGGMNNVLETYLAAQ